MERAVASLSLGLAMTVAAVSGASPLHLLAEPVDAGVRLTIVGSSRVACDTSYELKVVGAAGGNRSVQRGSARLAPGKQVVIATTTLGNQASEHWSATLSVDSCDGKHYEQVETGPR